MVWINNNMLRKPIEFASRRLIRNYSQNNELISLNLFTGYTIIGVISGIAMGGAHGQYRFRKDLQNEEYSTSSVMMVACVDAIVTGFFCGIMWPATLPCFIYDIKLNKFKIGSNI